MVNPFVNGLRLVNNNSVASIATITTTSTSVIPHVQPSSDIALALTLGTPFACDDVYLCSIEVDGDSGDDDSVDQQKWNNYFFNLTDIQHMNIMHRRLPVMVCVWTFVLDIKHVVGLLMGEGEEVRSAHLLSITD